MRPLLRFDGATRRHTSVIRWFERRGDALGAIARHWFEVVRESGDDVDEILHDDQPTACVDGAAFAYVDVYRAHVNVGFFHGAALPDPAKLLEGSGKFMRHVKLRPDDEVDEAAFAALIHSAYADVKMRLESEQKNEAP